MENAKYRVIAPVEESEDLVDVTIATVEDAVEHVTDSWVHRFFDWIEGILRLCWPKV